MRILVLDTIHGGRTIALALRERGHTVDMVDIYRGKEGISPSDARSGDYEMIIAPVHLDPGHPLLRDLPAPLVSHHEAVRWIIGKQAPARFIEVTGARGKTTVASAMAHVMQGPGILHTSRATVRLPENETMGRLGITPASLIAPAHSAYSQDRWLIGEVSLGFVGAGNLGILSSAGTYTFGAGKRDALSEKLRSGNRLPLIIVPPGFSRSGNRLPADEVALSEGSMCRYEWDGITGRYENPLLVTKAYRDPLLLATAAACVLGIDPSPLAGFKPLEGRKTVSWVGRTLVMDDSNSGTCAGTARDAIRLARARAGRPSPLVLVIGKEAGAICEGFPPDEVASVISTESPDHVILVGDYDLDEVCRRWKGKGSVLQARTLEEGRTRAMQFPDGSIVVLAVKTWR
ncbi:MAG TPA: coenzyme F430 synthase [Methanolinea sp.]|nr:coenzyme F430 synthase [Methanolinea sp.]HPC55548.1 coenzyme F430 synthase [Methanolinea sp.]HQE85799.1 coenzyme F430 synthase [Methanolinea sp.]HQI13609.1 coenzyme F430 synthase [Methanolinea sp.]HQJ18544.1 coenzyme F430 synthase [Methanolinea sp.]